jgi:hypothetical protein
MDSLRFIRGFFFASAAFAGLALAGCAGGTSSPQVSQASGVSASAVTRAAASVAPAAVRRPGFLGAFFRPSGPPPFGVFTPQAAQSVPAPYPVKGAGPLTGPGSYCDGVAANGVSIDSSSPVDTTKLTDMIYLGARWMRMPVSQFNDDGSHIFGAGRYQFTDLDAAQCIAVAYHGMKPVIGLEAGPVMYDATPGTFSPTSVPTYRSAADFATWCGAVAAHEKSVFGVAKFSLPGNEVNTNPQLFPGGEPQIAAYAKACYAAIKAANPGAFVYGFELNMDGQAGATQFVADERALGCGPGTCYDGIAMHLTLRYPIPPASTPCYPKPGGDYSMQCISDVQAAAQAPIHVLISETVYPVPGAVPDEQTKAQAIVAEAAAYAANPTIDGMLYANVDECALYPTGYFMNGCLIDTSGNDLPAWQSLQWYASQHLL